MTTPLQTLTSYANVSRAFKRTTLFSIPITVKPIISWNNTYPVPRIKITAVQFQTSPYTLTSVPLSSSFPKFRTTELEITISKKWLQKTRAHFGEGWHKTNSARQITITQGSVREVDQFPFLSVLILTHYDYLLLDFFFGRLRKIFYQG